jgi:hypothetical protein
LQASTEATARKFFSLKCQQFLNSLPENIAKKAAEAKATNPHTNEQNISRSITLYLGSLHAMLTSNLQLLSAQIAAQ